MRHVAAYYTTRVLTCNRTLNNTGEAKTSNQNLLPINQEFKDVFQEQSHLLQETEFS